MYNPVKDGIEKTARSVRYTEALPPADLAALVHCFWELKTDMPLTDDFHLHVLPDACVNILFNMRDTKIAAVTALQAKYEVLNLGKSFNYVGAQLLPGVWRGNRDELFDRYVDSPYAGTLPLIETAEKLAPVDFTGKQPILVTLVRQLVATGAVTPNEMVTNILKRLDTVHTVADMAALTGVSARQLQRILKQTTGFSPHDFLKVVRLQRSFGRDYLTSYTDQSHFIHSFRKMTGYTPAAYYKRFDV